MTTPATVLAQLKAMGNPSDLKGMARYGIRTDNAFGVKMPAIKAMVTRHKGDQDLALELWDSGYREARLLAAFIADRKLITEDLMEKWVKDFDSWDVCDTTTMQLFRYSPLALEKALEWSLSDDLFTRRSAFALMASLALKSSNLLNPAFGPFLDRVKACSTDDRNLVKKSVSEIKCLTQRPSQ